jgi:hypothetical protein
MLQATCDPVAHPPRCIRPLPKPLYQLMNLSSGKEVAAPNPDNIPLGHIDTPRFKRVFSRSPVHKRTLLTSEFDPLHTKLISSYLCI